MRPLVIDGNRDYPLWGYQGKTGVAQLLHTLVLGSALFDLA